MFGVKVDSNVYAGSVSPKIFVLSIKFESGLLIESGKPPSSIITDLSCRILREVGTTVSHSKPSTSPALSVALFS